RLDLDPADGLGHGHQVGDQRGIGLGPLVHLRPGHHQGVALGERADRQERHAGLVLPDEAAGQVTVDDAGEDGAHGVVSSIVVGSVVVTVVGSVGCSDAVVAPGSPPVATGRPGVLDQADQEPGYSAARWPAMLNAATWCAADTPDPQ